MAEVIQHLSHLQVILQRHLPLMRFPMPWGLACLRAEMPICPDRDMDMCACRRGYCYVQVLKAKQGSSQQYSSQAERDARLKKHIKQFKQAATGQEDQLQSLQSQEEELGTALNDLASVSWLDSSNLSRSGPSTSDRQPQRDSIWCSWVCVLCCDMLMRLLLLHPAGDWRQDAAGVPPE